MATSKEKDWKLEAKKWKTLAYLSATQIVDLLNGKVNEAEIMLCQWLVVAEDVGIEKAMNTDTFREMYSKRADQGITQEEFVHALRSSLFRIVARTEI